MKTKKVSRVCKQCKSKYLALKDRNKHFCSEKCFTDFRNRKKNNGLCKITGCNHKALNPNIEKRLCRKHQDEKNSVNKKYKHSNDALAEQLVKGLAPSWHIGGFREQSGRSIILDTLGKVGLTFVNEPLTKVYKFKKSSNERCGDLLIPEINFYIEAKRGVKTACVATTSRQYNHDLNLLKKGYNPNLDGFYYSIIGDIGHSLSEALMILQIKIKDAVKNGSLKHKPWITTKLINESFDPIIRELLSREQALGIN